MRLIKVKNTCDCCDYYIVSKQVKINPHGPQIDSNLIYMCEKCELKYENRDKWGEWLNAVKGLHESTHKNLS